MKHVFLLALLGVCSVSAVAATPPEKPVTGVDDVTALRIEVERLRNNLVTPFVLEQSVDSAVERRDSVTGAKVEKRLGSFQQDMITAVKATIADKLAPLATRADAIDARQQAQQAQMAALSADLKAASERAKLDDARNGELAALRGELTALSARVKLLGDQAAKLPDSAAIAAALKADMARNQQALEQSLQQSLQQAGSRNSVEMDALSLRLKAIEVQARASDNAPAIASLRAEIARGQESANSAIVSLRKQMDAKPAAVVADTVGRAELAKLSAGTREQLDALALRLEVLEAQPKAPDGSAAITALHAELIKSQQSAGAANNAVASLRKEMDAKPAPVVADTTARLELAKLSAGVREQMDALSARLKALEGQAKTPDNTAAIATLRTEIARGQEFANSAITALRKEIDAQPAPVVADSGNRDAVGRVELAKLADSTREQFAAVSARLNVVETQTAAAAGTRTELDSLKKTVESRPAAAPARTEPIGLSKDELARLTARLDRMEVDRKALEAVARAAATDEVKTQLAAAHPAANLKGLESRLAGLEKNAAAPAVAVAPARDDSGALKKQIDALSARLESEIAQGRSAEGELESRIQAVEILGGSGAAAAGDSRKLADELVAVRARLAELEAAVIRVGGSNAAKPR